MLLTTESSYERAAVADASRRGERCRAPSDRTTAVILPEGGELKAECQPGSSAILERLLGGFPITTVKVMVALSYSFQRSDAGGCAGCPR